MKNYFICNQAFEWDDSKNLTNIKKHGISFETAAHVFWDEHYIEFRDITHSGYEDRFIVIGLVDELLFVVYTEHSASIRLISARLANDYERKLYYGNCRDVFKS